jgi:hypothetical protein
MHFSAVSLMKSLYSSPAFAGKAIAAPSVRIPAALDGKPICFAQYWIVRPWALYFWAMNATLIVSQSIANSFLSISLNCKIYSISVETGL